MRDRLTGAIFRVSASNVQQDAVLYNDSWWDTSWDAVWQSQVSVDEQGWSAEVRIPLSQLRFAIADQQTWGINVERFVRRKNEYSWLEMVPKNENGMASRMLDLSGLDGMRPRRNLELLPYVAGRVELVEPATSGNPFNDGSRGFGAAGLDMKWGLTSNLTVSATVNPDFGQVEVDPAVVNLTAFETFFPEKRPFFLEGSQIFNNFGRGGANDFWGFNNSEPQIFYSRRIGRAPQLAVTGDYVDGPTATTILGAAKLTGKTAGRWSLGLLQAVTGEETARISLGGPDTSAVVEPLTSYTVARVQRDFGRTGLGFITTSVSRQLETAAAKNGLTNQAMAAGVDAYWFLDSRKVWVITGDIAGSRVAGSAAVIEKLQRAPQRYYQRPDADHVELDATRTSLHGFTGRINLNRNSGLWRVNAALWSGSPGLGIERPRLPQHRRSRRRSRRPVHPGQQAPRLQPVAERVGGQVLDLELRPRDAVRRLQRPRQQHLHELLVRRRQRRHPPAGARRSAHARRPVGRQSRWRVLQRGRKYSTPAGGSRSRATTTRTGALRAAGAATRRCRSASSRHRVSRCPPGRSGTAPARSRSTSPA